MWGATLLLMALPPPLVLVVEWPDRIRPFVLVFLGALACTLGARIVRHEVRWALAWAVLLGAAALRDPDPRPLLILGCLLAGALFLAAAEDLPAWGYRMVRALALGGLLVNLVLGIVNLSGIHPETCPYGLTCEPRALTPHEEQMRFSPTGFFSHPTYWGLAMAFGVPLLWPWSGALVVPAILSGSRGAAALALGACLLLAWPLVPLKARRWGLAAVGASIVTLGIVHVARHGLAQLWSAGGRLAGWGYGLSKWMNEALLQGHGLGSWARWAHQNPGWHPVNPDMDVAFSEPLQLGYETGIIGLGLGVWLGVLIVRAALRAPFSPAAATVFQALVGLWVMPVFRLPWVALVILLAAGQVLATPEPSVIVRKRRVNSPTTSR